MYCGGKGKKEMFHFSLADEGMKREMLFFFAFSETEKKKKKKKVCGERIVCACAVRWSFFFFLPCCMLCKKVSRPPSHPDGRMWFMNLYI